jgi:hypothetical protein
VLTVTKSIETSPVLSFANLISTTIPSFGIFVNGSNVILSPSTEVASNGSPSTFTLISPDLIVLGVNFTVNSSRVKSSSSALDGLILNVATVFSAFLRRVFSVDSVDSTFVVPLSFVLNFTNSS